MCNLGEVLELEALEKDTQKERIRKNVEYVRKIMIHDVAFQGAWYQIGIPASLPTSENVFQESMGTRLSVSTTFHPQTDG